MKEWPCKRGRNALKTWSTVHEKLYTMSATKDRWNTTVLAMADGKAMPLTVLRCNTELVKECGKCYIKLCQDCCSCIIMHIVYMLLYCLVYVQLKKPWHNAVQHLPHSLKRSATFFKKLCITSKNCQQHIFTICHSQECGQAKTDICHTISLFCLTSQNKIEHTQH